MTTREPAQPLLPLALPAPAEPERPKRRRWDRAAFVAELERQAAAIRVLKATDPELPPSADDLEASLQLARRCEECRRRGEVVDGLCWRCRADDEREDG